MTAVLKVPSGDRTRPDGSHRTGAALGVGGAALVVFGTVMHPAHADPAEAAVAFAEYAGTPRAEWVAAHLLQLAGLAGVVLAVVLLAGAVAGSSTAWTRLTRACGAASLATAAVLQAVDGVALKVAVDVWSAAPDADRPALFAAAQAVRGIEVGLDGVFALLLAATVVGLGAVHLTAPRGTRSLGVLACAGGGVGAVGGVLFCLQGFSPLAMNVSLAGLAFGLVAVLATAVRGLRRGVER